MGSTLPHQLMPPHGAKKQTTDTFGLGIQVGAGPVRKAVDHGEDSEFGAGKLRCRLQHSTPTRGSAAQLWGGTVPAMWCARLCNAGFTAGGEIVLRSSSFDSHSHSTAPRNIRVDIAAQVEAPPLPGLLSSSSPKTQAHIELLSVATCSEQEAWARTPCCATELSLPHAARSAALELAIASEPRQVAWRSCGIPL